MNLPFNLTGTPGLTEASDDGQEIRRKEQGLPEETPHLVAALYDRQDGGIFELKRVAECRRHIGRGSRF